MAVDRDFSHPYQPYDIQKHFMNGVYDCIESGKVGIFESPTDEAEPAWIIEHAQTQKRQAMLRRKQEEETRLAAVRAREKRQKERTSDGERSFKKLRAEADQSGIESLHDASFLLDDYESDDDHKIPTQRSQFNDLPAKTQELMKKLGMDVHEKHNDESEIEDEVKIITLPYPMLLQRSAREALGLSLKNNVVIIDEAHNLMDAITGIHTIEISLTQLQSAKSQLMQYLQKFRNRLRGKNRVYVAQLVRVLDSLVSALQRKIGHESSKDGLVSMGDILSGQGVDQVNFHKLLRYLQESKLARKVDGYNTHADFLAKDVNDPKAKGKPLARSKPEPATPVLTQIQGFLQALTNPSPEGRVFYSKTGNVTGHLKYMLLDPTHHFKEILEEARAVILAGGTMSPMSDYTNHLFGYLPKNQIQTLSCGHVIPPQNLEAWPLSSGPTEVELDFTFKKRSTDRMVDELARVITSLCSIIPDGIVVFFQSYSYLEQVIQRWQRPNGLSPKSAWNLLSERKPIFREAKDSSNVDDTLQDYSHSIDLGHGGLLLAVVGGKMSEGINFADKLGRGVVLVGLPFPNIHTAEWTAKLEHIENAAFDRSAEDIDKSEGARRSEAKAAGREYYENACMRAVNQSIGRAIRHQNDYAAILLLDQRYAGEKIKSKLPGWIQKGLVRDPSRRSYSDMIASLNTFFAAKEVG
ncbi:MAG: ATP-dependent DNA helicase chl1 [Piccolia ochrophora]|nr:MAG: ATP-dependent DNA helicase chl1 [Piccolia ochrophora]